jgi:hypothetical protein
VSVFDKEELWFTFFDEDTQRFATVSPLVAFIKYGATFEESRAGSLSTFASQLKTLPKKRSGPDKKIQTLFRLDPLARRSLAVIQERYGLESQTAAVELVLYWFMEELSKMEPGQVKNEA